MTKTTKLCTLLGIGAVSFLQAQQQPTPVTKGPENPSDEVIFSKLQGSKVRLSNPVLNFGDRNQQIRTFDNGLAAGFEMDNGVLFATANTNFVLLPNKYIDDRDQLPDDQQLTSPANGVTHHDPDLKALDSGAEHDVVSYEFDVTLAETATALNVSYQFGSEEYPSYVGSKFNDAFGFFISGPGIDTNTQGAINGKLNMARAINNNINPPSDVITSVNTINDGIYDAGFSSPRTGRPIDNRQTSIFINNGYTGDVTPQGQNRRKTNTLGPEYASLSVKMDEDNPPKIHTIFNGMTKVIHYSLKGLQPGGTYRFKIIIGDTEDSNLDSGVFIDQVNAYLDLEAKNDRYTLAAGGSSTTPILTNDIYKGYFGTIQQNNSTAILREKPLERSMVTISAPLNIVKVEADGTRTASSGFTFDSNGKIKVASSVAEGTYEFDYTICDAIVPNYCSTAKVTVVVEGKVDTPPTSQCIKPSEYNGTGTATKVGISTIGQPNAGWPENIPNGHIVMTSKEKGFAITQVANVSAIAKPVEGMLVYDLTDKCVKLYDGTAWKCLEKLTECE